MRIFLGAAPGVGKTYEMLSQARNRRVDSGDTVIGVVETHGRVDTQALTKGFDIIPKKRVPYKGRVVAEMDLDAILQRKPKLVLVDELAHTNAPGSRHPKRYQDVEEILEHGIDVYTTLNVQHLESLNDVVAQITHVRVRETVPDSILDSADDVELVDLTPDDLLQRLKEGKVYLGDAAERAAQNYFVPGNLTALRELALRRTAQRVDAQMVNYMNANAIQGPWEAGERVLACIDESPGSAALVRYARRFAEKLRASWTVMHVETSASAGLSEAERSRVAEALRIAERLGGQAVTIPAVSVADGILDYARVNNITHILVNAPRRSWLLELFRQTLADRIIRHAGNTSVQIVPTEQDKRPSAGLERHLTLLHPSRDVRGYLTGFLFSAIALAVGLVLQRFLGITNISLVFLTAVLATAITYGLWPALFASLVSVLAFNFFFLPPLYTFRIQDPENVNALFFFAVVAFIASNLTARVRGQAVVARERAKATEDLYLFSRKLAGVVTMDDLLWATAFQIAEMLKVRVVILLPEGPSVAVRAGYPPEDALEDADIAAARWVWEHGTAAGRGADTLPGAKWLFLPMRTGRGTVGVVGLDSDKAGALLSPDQRRLFDALADQTALAVERINLADDIDRNRLSAETERLRSALLTSISHDLRTPLASILGAASTLKSYHTSLDEPARDELLASIAEEAERLNRFIANLLDMTRLESGAIAPNMEPNDLADVMGSALRRAGKVMAQHEVVFSMEPGLPMLHIDAVLFEQAVFNLLDNAAKYSPPGSKIEVKAARAGDQVRVSVADEGDGIPPDDVERIFDKFYRVQASDKKRAGTGLGLAISRGFVESVGGTLTAANRSGPGAVFTITLPVPAETAERAA
ncbi:MAG TPA: sensor histidine kinase KdpD [Rhizomicrobium sp.]|nr:sensor histidine kinase KdpD [Rhizomicrobium sp.]